MSANLLQQSESFLSDKEYGRFPSGWREAPRRSLQRITMEESNPFSIHFDTEVAFNFDQMPEEWFMPLLEQVCDLGMLLPNWDSYGARPIDPRIAAHTVSILMDTLDEGSPFPAVVPTSRGGIQLEWHAGGIDLEVDVRSPWSMDVFFEDGTLGTEKEVENAKIDFIREKLDLLRNRLR